MLRPVDHARNRLRSPTRRLGGPSPRLECPPGMPIFAPVAALLASGKSPAGMGPKVQPKDLNFAVAKKTDKGFEATVIYVDRFGNLILNMRILPPFPVSLKGIRLKPVRTYAQARRIEPLITQGSHGFVEIAVNQGNAAEAFCLKAGDRIELEEI